MKPFLILVLATVLAACGSASARSGGSTAGPCSHAKVVSEGANGTRVRLCVRQVLVLRLHSTYWQSAGSSPQAVLRRKGPTIVKPAASTSCVPGAGCGTSTTRFVGVAAGTARVTSHRRLCGEALQCTGRRGSFELVVVVRSR